MTSETAKIFSSDSVCKRLLWECTSVTNSSILASSGSTDVTQAQFEIVRSQRIAMANRMNAKFCVTGEEREEPVTWNYKFGLRKFILADVMYVEPEDHYSSIFHFNSSRESSKSSLLIRRIIEEDLIAAHAKNVSTLSKKFNSREVREMEEFLSSYDTKRCDDDCEMTSTHDNFERTKKITFFDALDLVEDCLSLYQGCMRIDERLECTMNEVFYSADTVIKNQNEIVRNFRESEANSTTMGDIDMEPAETNTFFAKFVTLSDLEYCKQTSSNVESYILEACTSIVMPAVEENSLMEKLPEHSIFVCADYGIQNHHLLLETFVPLATLNDESEDFLLATEAYSFETIEEIKVRSLISFCLIARIPKFTTVQHCVRNDSIYMRNNCCKSRRILAASRECSCKEEWEED
jgi:hypothetical protein